MPKRAKADWKKGVKVWQQAVLSSVSWWGYAYGDYIDLNRIALFFGFALGGKTAATTRFNLCWYLPTCKTIRCLQRQN
jgi:hypothetical protein